VIDKCGGGSGRIASARGAVVAQVAGDRFAGWPQQLWAVVLLSPRWRGLRIGLSDRRTGRRSSSAEMVVGWACHDKGSRWR
jgi:hypothetical protein